MQCDTAAVKRCGDGGISNKVQRHLRVPCSIQHCIRSGVALRTLFHLLLRQLVLATVFFPCSNIKFCWKFSCCQAIQGSGSIHLPHVITEKGILILIYLCINRLDLLIGIEILERQLQLFPLQSGFLDAEIQIVGAVFFPKFCHRSAVVCLLQQYRSKTES